MATSGNTQSSVTINLATTPWCPYTCGSSGEDYGVVGHYIQEIFKQIDVELQIKSYPWSRAIELANAGEVDGLLTATHSEAPNLIFSANPIANYHICFFTLPANPWRYAPELQLGGNSLAVAQTVMANHWIALLKATLSDI